MAAILRVDIDLAGLQEAVVRFAIPAIRRAISATAEHGVERWQKQVADAKLSPFEKELYIKSISWAWTGQLSAEISTSYGGAEGIEEGRPARDMKLALKTSRNTRIAQSAKHRGQHYLIIPFRHNTPGMSAHARPMPANIYAQAKGLEKSYLLPPGSKPPPMRRSGHGYLVPQNSYRWAQGPKGALPAGLAEKMKPHHKTDIYDSMRRMETSAGKGRSSEFITFRTMGEWSDGWVIPAKGGLYIARDVAEWLKPRFEALMSAAVTGRT